MHGRLTLLFKVLLVVWLVGLYIFMIRPLSPAKQEDKKTEIDENYLLNQVNKLEEKLNEQSSFYHSLLDKLRNLKKQQTPETDLRDVQSKKYEDDPLHDGPVIPVLLIACNREAAVKRSLDLLIKYRPSQKRFPIIVSQDCGHEPTKRIILSYENQVTLIEQPDLRPIDVPVKEKKFKGYFQIARHYKWALDQIFHKFNYETVIIMEDDLDVSPDFYEYFAATYPLLKTDPTIWCVSAWNDNGKSTLVDTESGSDILYRTDFFPGLGWMMTRDIWGELGPKWPRSYWDDWVRSAKQRLGRACIRPEVSRTKTFGKKGVSNGLFYEKFLKYIYLNAKNTEFTQMDLSYLRKDQYDDAFDREVQRSQVVTLNEVKSGRLPEGTYRLIYHTKDIFKKTAKALGLMDDFKDGVPRTGYRGVVPFFYGGRRIYLAPNNNWKNYDPSWS